MSVARVPDSCPFQSILLRGYNLVKIPLNCQNNNVEVALLFIL